MWGRKNRGWGLEDKGLPSVGACQHQSLNLSLGSKRCRNLEKELSFLPNDAGISMKTKGCHGKLWKEAGMSMKTKGCHGKLWKEAGMSMKTKGIRDKVGNVAENKQETPWPTLFIVEIF